MSKVFYWSDLHFGHEFVARERRFYTAEQHDKYLQDMWRARVGKRDVVWILGDLAMGSPARALEIIGNLPGTKHLIFGNHDQGHPMHRGSHSKQRRYLEVFDSVQAFDRPHIEGRGFLVSHFPYQGSGDHDGKEERYSQYRLPDVGLPLIHGHVHGEWRSKGTQVNVGVDRWMAGPAEAREVLRVLEQSAGEA